MERYFLSGVKGGRKPLSRLARQAFWQRCEVWTNA